MNKEDKVSFWTIEKIQFIILLIWYIVLISLSFGYCLTHWTSIMNSKPFEGKFVLLIYMLALSIVPLTDKIGFKEFFIEFFKYKEAKKHEKETDEFEKQVEKLEKGNPSKLKTPVKKGGKNVQ
ncbi:MAG: hypothetical protein FWE17_00545 [Alphaproteobacteria bacterium]|nr:hypothetical protein [Alphaproteobacteria bacterium]